MPRTLFALIALAVCLSMAAPAYAAVAHKKPRHAYRHERYQPRSYGFLPGVRTPRQIERDRARQYYASGPHWYGPAWPGFYHGRWNGGGFGPCYTRTPIGFMWTCGR